MLRLLASTPGATALPVPTESLPEIPGEAISGKLPHTSGVDIVAGSPEALSAGLAGLRPDLKVAQRKDPRLLEIVGVLEKKPAGEFLTAPWKDLRRAKARALADDRSYLAEDGVLMVRADEEQF